MKANDYISKKEHNFLLSTVFFAFLLRIISSAISIYSTDPTPNKNFAIYSIFDMTEIMSPIYSFIVFFICIFLVWKINFATIIDVPIKFSRKSSSLKIYLGYES